MVSTIAREKYAVDPVDSVSRAQARTHVALSLCLALPACLSYAPDALEPGVELGLLGERSSGQLSAAHLGPLNTSWFPLREEVEFGDGLSLEEANALALYYSPRILEARADTRIAAAQVLRAGVLANPDFFVGPRFTTDGGHLKMPAGMSWELPLWGKIDARRDRAGAELDEQTLRVIQVELEVLQEVREAYIRLARLQQEEVLLAEVSAAGDEILDWVERLQAAGIVDTVALFLARTEREEARASLEEIRMQARRQRRDLCAVLGLLPDAELVILVDGEESAMPELPPSDSGFLLRQPSLRAAEAAYAAADAALRLEIGEQYPDIRLGPEFEYDEGQKSIGFGLGFSLPLFDRNEGNIMAAEESRQRARERYRENLLGASHAEALAREDLELAEELLQIYSEGAARSAEEAGRAVQIRLRAGRAEVIEVLTAQRAIARTRARILQLSEEAARARLRAAVAGGFALAQVEAEDESSQATTVKENEK